MSHITPNQSCFFSYDNISSIHKGHFSIYFCDAVMDGTTKKAINLSTLYHLGPLNDQRDLANLFTGPWSQRLLMIDWSSQHQVVHRYRANMLDVWHGNQIWFPSLYTYFAINLCCNFYQAKRSYMKQYIIYPSKTFTEWANDNLHSIKNKFQRQCWQ